MRHTDVAIAGGGLCRLARSGDQLGSRRHLTRIVIDPHTTSIRYDFRGRSSTARAVADVLKLTGLADAVMSRFDRPTRNAGWRVMAEWSTELPGRAAAGHSLRHPGQHDTLAKFRASAELIQSHRSPISRQARNGKPSNYRTLTRLTRVLLCWRLASTSGCARSSASSRRDHQRRPIRSRSGFDVEPVGRAKCLTFSTTLNLL